LENIDVIIIGGGPIGITCGIECEKKGLNYKIIEKGMIVNSIFNFPTNMTFFSTSKNLEIGEVPFVSHTDKPTRKEALEYFRRVVEKWKLNISVYEEVKKVLKTNNQFVVETNNQKHTTKNVIVTTGFYDTPRMLNIPGENLSKVKHYYDEPHPYVGQKLAIIGAGNSGCDVALEAFHKGADVTMIVRKPNIKPTVKYWIKPNIENRIKEGSIKAYFETVVKEIKTDKILISNSEGERWIENDFVLAMTGYKPNYEFLQKIGVTFDESELRKPVINSESFESQTPGLYLAGVIIMGLNTSKLFIENTRHHAGQIIGDILNKKFNE
jgi:thioredoxin reductase (NADPH)